MGKPRIVREIKREPPLERRPSPSELSFGLHEIRPEVYIRAEVLQKMIEYTERHKNTEVMGLLLGESFKDENGIGFTIVYAATETALSGLETSLSGVNRDRENAEEMGKLFEQIDDKRKETRRDLLAVGWHHSHPGHGIFLSNLDVRSTMRSFTGTNRNAFVIDPQRKMLGFFRVYKKLSVLSTDRPLSFALIGETKIKLAKAEDREGEGVYMYRLSKWTVEYR